LVLLFLSCGTSEERLTRRANKIQAGILTVDSHCDTPLELIKNGINLGIKNSIGTVDFPRMKEGGLDAAFFAVFIGQGVRNDSAYNAVHNKVLNTFEAINRSVGENSSMAGIATTPEEAYKLKKVGKSAVFIGVENGYAIGKDISKIEEYYNLGARYMTLSHSRNNDICDSSTDRAGAENNGLSKLGEEVVKEMNRLGMIVDVSHISDDSFTDVLNISDAPVIASHSSCRALCETPRNLTDDMLVALKKNGGVIQICLLGSYLLTPEHDPLLDVKLREVGVRYGDYGLLSEDMKKMMRAEYDSIRTIYEKRAGVKDAVDHIDHVVQVIGIDYVGIGSDFDGGGGIEGCKSVADMKNITVELLRRGYTKSEIEKIWGGNLMRVMKEVEKKRL
jgi:membrane dipeptidase